MSLHIVTGSYTEKAMQGMLAEPSDREAATRSVVEAAGGKMLAYYLTTGDSDFMVIVDSPSGEDMLPPLMVAGATGSVCNLKTIQAYTSKQFMAAQKKAAEIASAFKPAG